MIQTESKQQYKPESETSSLAMTCGSKTNCLLSPGNWLLKPYIHRQWLPWNALQTHIAADTKLLLEITSVWIPRTIWWRWFHVCLRLLSTTYMLLLKAGGNYFTTWKHTTKKHLNKHKSPLGGPKLFLRYPFISGSNKKDALINSMQCI